MSACIAQTQVLRYTPAGVPAIDLTLEHESCVEQAGQTRQVKATVKAVAFGAMAERLVKQTIGSHWRFSGFLANSMRGKQLVLHIQDFEQDLAQPNFPDGANDPSSTQ